MFNLTHKVAVVTGGGSGIGRSIVQAMARQGASVHILDVAEAQAEEVRKAVSDAGGRCEVHLCDVSNQEQVRRVMGQIFQAEKRLDILVNNAGISHIGTVESTSEADFDHIYSVNVKGVYNCMHVAVPMMKLRGGGSIINLASVVSSVGIPERFAYSMSKGAVLSMTYSVAKDCVPHGIRVNSVAPGRVHTPFVDGYLARHYPGRESEMFDKLAKTQPIGRMAQPEEIATLVLYLASDEASFITGSNFPIDGGFVTLNAG